MSDPHLQCVWYLSHLFLGLLIFGLGVYVGTLIP